MKDLTKRLLMGLWGIPLILGLSLLGGYYFLTLVLIINGMALWEFYSMYQNQGYYAYRVLGVVLSTILLLSAFWLPLESLMIVFLIAVIIILLRHLRISKPNPTSNTVLTLGGIIYITLFLIALIKLRLGFTAWNVEFADNYAGGRFLILIWISIWLCDTFAYFGGRFFGKHKLAPRASPNKTVEGAVFGFLGAIVIFIGIGPVLLPHFPSLHLWLSAIIVGIFGQLGDLVESRFKRDASVKDTSTVLPGHGGFLDRFDSVIFVSPFFYIFFNFLKP